MRPTSYMICSSHSLLGQRGPEYQELRWQRLAVLKQRRAEEGALLDGQSCASSTHPLGLRCLFPAYDSIVQNMELSEAALTESVSPQYPPFSALHSSHPPKYPAGLENRQREVSPCVSSSNASTRSQHHPIIIANWSPRSM